MATEEPELMEWNDVLEWLEAAQGGDMGGEGMTASMVSLATALDPNFFTPTTVERKRRSKRLGPLLAISPLRI